MIRRFMGRSLGETTSAGRKKLHLMRRPASRSAAFVFAAALSAFIILSLSQVAVARDFVDQLNLQQLRTSDRVVLMMVPIGSIFPIAINPTELGAVSCQYEINRGPIFEELLHALDSNIVEYKVGSRKFGVRIGIVFERDRKVIREFYFNDAGGPGQLVGSSGNHLVIAKGNLANELRALAIRPSVVLIKDHHSKCPHA